MILRQLRLAILILLLCALATPVSVRAQDNTPILQRSGLAECTQSGDCSVLQLFDLGNSLIQWAVGISGAMALLMYIIGGTWMLFSSGNQGRVQRGKDILTGTSIAMIFILGSWLVIDFTVRALKGEPNEAQLDIAFCNDPGNDGNSCDDDDRSKICFNGSCVTRCNALAQRTGSPFQCQAMLSCGATLDLTECTPDHPFCRTGGLCPNEGVQSVCCFAPDAP